MNRKVSQKAQKLANEYLQHREHLKDGQEFSVYANSRWYTFTVKNVMGYREAKFSYYGQ